MTKVLNPYGLPYVLLSLKHLLAKDHVDFHKMGGKKWESNNLSEGGKLEDLPGLWFPSQNTVCDAEVRCAVGRPPTTFGIYLLRCEVPIFFVLLYF